MPKLFMPVSFYREARVFKGPKKSRQTRKQLALGVWQEAGSRPGLRFPIRSVVSAPVFDTGFDLNLESGSQSVARYSNMGFVS